MTVGRPAKMAVFFDSPDEGWYAMDLAGEMLVERLRAEHAGEIEPTSITVPIARLARRVPRLGRARAAFNADRVAARFLAYPARALRARRRFDYFHVVDHTYAQLVHSLVPARTGVYCHDVDAFRPLFDPAGDPRPSWFRALVRVTLKGMQSAAIVFHNTRVVGDQIARMGWIEPSRLVYAPLGVAPEFEVAARNDTRVDDVLARLEGRRFVLHVGSSIPRKRIDVLFGVFARLLRADPELRLVQQGAELTDEQRTLARSLGIEGAMIRASKEPLDRRVLAGIYARAAVVLVPSDAEGFGLPVIEALACGAPVVASDLPVLREVGEDAALYAPVADVEAWAALVTRVLDGSLAGPPREARVAQASKYGWSRHAKTIADAYLALGAEAKS